MPDDSIDRVLFCSRCGQPVVVPGASFCKDCGARLAGADDRPPGRDYNPLVAAMLSIVPGLGHLYRGRLGRAILWFFGVTFAYGAGRSLGLLIHFICAVSAALPRGRGNRGYGVEGSADRFSARTGSRL